MRTNRSHRRNWFIVSSVAALVLTVLGARTYGGLITNGSFEEDTDGNNVPDGWVFSGNLDRLNATGTSGWYALDGDFAVFFGNGNRVHDGVIEQTLSTAVGVDYMVSFGLARFGISGGLSRLDVSVIDLSDSSVLATLEATYSGGDGRPDPINDPYLIFEFQFTATSNQTLLRFADDPDIVAGDNSDPVLDDVHVNALTAVPEPSSFALLGMGGLSLFGYRWRRKRHNLA